MAASVDEVLKREFGMPDGLGQPGVKILDPATGTGNFIVNILQRIPARHLRQKYTEDLFCNEVMLLPYYIACLNIEHEYYARSGEYEPFEGACFADTLDMAESRQMSLVQRGELRARAGREGRRDHGRHRQPALQRRAGERERQQQEPRISR